MAKTQLQMRNETKKGDEMSTTKIMKCFITKKDGEYWVRLFIDGEYQAGADYFTPDIEDARQTSALMIKNGGPSDKTTDFAKEEQADHDEENEK